MGQHTQHIEQDDVEDHDAYPKPYPPATRRGLEVGDQIVTPTGQMQRQGWGFAYNSFMVSPVDPELCQCTPGQLPVSRIKTVIQSLTVDAFVAAHKHTLRRTGEQAVAA